VGRYCSGVVKAALTGRQFKVWNDHDVREKVNDFVGFNTTRRKSVM